MQRITKFNVFPLATLRNIKDGNWWNKLVDLIKLTTKLNLMLISKCNASDKERFSLTKIVFKPFPKYNRLDYIVSE